MIENLQNLTSNTERYESFRVLIEHFKLEIGIEVGVREAWFSKFLVMQTQLRMVYGIDCEICINACNLQKQYPDKYIFRQERSPECASKFDNRSLCFAHLDSCHEQCHVYKELEAFWPKLKVGGIISGDDFMAMDIPGEGSCGVMQAVYNFTKELNVQFYITGTSETSPDKLCEYGTIMGNKRARGEISYQQIPNLWV